MKIKALIIEIGIRNIKNIKKLIKPENIEITYASSFLDIVDIIHLDKVHLIFLSDFRGIKSTIGYIKMFKTTNPEIILILLSNDNVISERNKSYFIQRGVDEVLSCYDLQSLHNYFNNKYSIIIHNNGIVNNWSICTKKAIRYLKNNYHISENIYKKLSNNINYSISTIVHCVKK